MSAYACLGFPNTSSNNLDTGEFGFPMEKTKRSTGVFLTRFQNHFSLKIRKAQDIGDKTVLCSMWGKLSFPSLSRESIMYHHIVQKPVLYSLSVQKQKWIEIS